MSLSLSIRTAGEIATDGGKNRGKIGSPSKELRLQKLKEQCVPRTAILDKREPYELGNILEPPHRYHNPLLGSGTSKKDERIAGVSIGHEKTQSFKQKHQSKPASGGEQDKHSSFKTQSAINPEPTGVKSTPAKGSGDSSTDAKNDPENQKNSSDRKLAQDDPDWTLVRTFLDIESGSRSSSVLRKITKPEYESLVSKFTREDWEAVRNLVFERGVAVVKETRAYFEKKQATLDKMGVFHPNANERRVQGLLQVKLRQRLRFAVLEGEILEQIFSNSFSEKKTSSVGTRKENYPKDPLSKGLEYVDTASDSRQSTKGSMKADRPPKIGKKSSRGDAKKPLGKGAGVRSEPSEQKKATRHPIRKPRVDKDSKEKTEKSSNLGDRGHTTARNEGQQEGSQKKKSHKTAGKEDPFDIEMQKRMDREKRNKQQASVYGGLNDTIKSEMSYQAATSTLAGIRNEQKKKLRKRLNVPGSEKHTELGFREPNKEEVILESTESTNESSKEQGPKSNKGKRQPKKKLVKRKDDQEIEATSTIPGSKKKLLSFEEFRKTRRNPQPHQTIMKGSSASAAKQKKKVEFTPPSEFPTEEKKKITPSIPLCDVEEYMKTCALKTLESVKSTRPIRPAVLIGSRIEETNTKKARPMLATKSEKKVKSGSIVVLRKQPSGRNLQKAVEGQSDPAAQDDTLPTESPQIDTSESVKGGTEQDEKEKSNNERNEDSQSQHSRASNKASSSEENPAVTKTDLQNQLEQLFNTLEMPVTQRMAMILKYSKPEHVLFLNDVIEQWLDAAKLVQLRERLARRMRKYIQQHENLLAEDILDEEFESKIRATGCYISPVVLFGKKPEEWLEQILLKLSEKCKEATMHLQDEYGETLTYRGTPYTRVLRMSPSVPPSYTVNKSWKRVSKFLLFE